MVCPSCGTQAEGPGKFCARCGARLPEPEATTNNAGGFAAAPPPPPPAWSGIPVAPPPPPAWSGAEAAPPPPPPPPAPPYGAPGQQYGAPPQQYGAPPQQYGAAPYGAPGYAQPAYAAAPARGNPAMFAGLIALVGGAAAIGSAWLPWTATASGDALLLPINVTASMSDIANGYYLIGGGAVAAAVGLLLLVGVAKSAGLRSLLAIVAVVAGVAVLAVTYTAYNHVSEQITYFGASQIKMGTAIYAGAAAGIASIVGGVLGLVAKG
jgi:hypothetical protein